MFYYPEQGTNGERGMISPSTILFINSANLVYQILFVCAHEHGRHHKLSVQHGLGKVGRGGSDQARSLRTDTMNLWGVSCVDHKNIVL